MEKYRTEPVLRKIGLIGGTFDPIHYAHLAIAEEARVALKLEEMVFIPAGQPPHKRGQTSTTAQQRLHMLQLAIASNPYFSYSRMELDRPGPSYTVDTLCTLRTQWGSNAELYFLIGWDSLEELHRWHDPIGILNQLTGLVVVGRPGYGDEREYNKQLEQRLPGITQRLYSVSAPLLDISSSDLRQRVTEGRPIKYQVPEAVERYIIEHRLYR